MKYENHLSDQHLVLDIDGELDSPEAREHLSQCSRCRARRYELDAAMTDYVRIHPVVDFEAPARVWRHAWAAAALVVVAAGLFFGSSIIARRSHVAVVSTPDARLTPGATLLVNRSVVCSQANTKNRTVPVSLQRKVFEEYGIAGANPRAYEVDYLVTPALGGAEDIHNLWPHSYSATVWNAQVKDALEDRMREMVCDGDLDLTEAQREIAGNWIAAYKKYFHTDEPLMEHRK